MKDQGRQQTDDTIREPGRSLGEAVVLGDVRIWVHVQTPGNPDQVTPFDKAPQGCVWDPPRPDVPGANQTLFLCKREDQTCVACLHRSPLVLEIKTTYKQVLLKSNTPAFEVKSSADKTEAVVTIRKVLLLALIDWTPCID